MPEQERNPISPAGEDPSSNGGDSNDVSMEEILDSLRSILEEEDQAPGQPSAAGVPEEEAPGGEGSELLLTDVVAGEGTENIPGPVWEAPEAAPESPTENPGANAPEAPGPSFEEPSAGEGGEGLRAPELEALSGVWEPQEDRPEEATQDIEDLEPLSLEIDNSHGESEWGPEVDEEVDEGFSGGGAAAPGSGEGAVADRNREAAEPDSQSPEPAGPVADTAPNASGVDMEALRQTVERTVQEQVASATAGLESALADALAPKIREALQEFLEERLPVLLRELAEEEIERIKRAE